MRIDLPAIRRPGCARSLRRDGAAQMPAVLRNLVGLQLKVVERPLIGIYFLCYQGEVIYVGQSKNLRARLNGHSRKQYDAIYLLEWPAADLDRVEAALIRTLRPKFNRNCHVGGYLERCITTAVRTRKS